MRAEIDYTYGYYRDLAPGLIDFSPVDQRAMLPPQTRRDAIPRAGLRPGAVSASIHAAACVGGILGHRFQSGPRRPRPVPGHASPKADARFFDDSFADFAGS